MGDMTPLFSAYYDTINAGLKQEPASYQRIIANEGIDPNAWLFLSDNVKGSSYLPRLGCRLTMASEVEAAKAAGMDSIVLVRPGNAALEDSVRDVHRVVDTFADIAI
jgi:enolase-phosphatase E1